MSSLAAVALLVQAALGSLVGTDLSPTVQSVDLIELNHFVDEDGREVFQQVIFYDWSQTHGRFHVRAWRLVKTPNQLPRKRWNPNRVECTWHDDGILRRVVAPSLRETWTQYDPERANRKLLPEERRKPLFGDRRAASNAPQGR